MKKSIFAVLFIALLAACQKEGPQGPAGQDGNANVFGKEYVVTFQQNQNTWLAAIQVPEINQEILDHGAVFVYAISNGSQIALPCVIPITSSYSSTYNVFLTLGGVGIQVMDTDLLLPEYPDVNTFKVVVIEGTGLIPDVDHTNYEAVKEAYHLE